MEEPRKMIDRLKKPHFVPGQTESGNAKKPGRIAENVFRVVASFDMLDANCQRTIHKNCLRTRIGGGVPVASQHTSSKKTTTFGYGQVTAPTPSENWKQSYELSL